jgi:hypothetical protein
MVTMAPPPESRIGGTVARQQLTTVRMFTSTTVVKSSSGVTLAALRAAGVTAPPAETDDSV